MWKNNTNMKTTEIQNEEEQIKLIEINLPKAVKEEGLLKAKFNYKTNDGYIFTITSHSDFPVNRAASKLQRQGIKIERTGQNGKRLITIPIKFMKNIENMETMVVKKQSHREPKFKEGDKVKVIETGKIETIESIGEWDEEVGQYRLLWSNEGVGDESDLELVSEKIEKIHEPEIKFFEYYKDVDFKYKNQLQKNKAIEELIDLKVKHEIITTQLMNRIIIAENNLTSDETLFINSYTGMGGLEKFGAIGEGILYEYYTPDEIIKMMWALAYKYGHKLSSVLEPSCGIGRFFKYAKKEIAIGYELNLKSAIICKILYPDVAIYNNYFEQIFIKNNNSVKNNVYMLPKYDLVIGNPPYGDIAGGGSKWLGMGEQKYTGATNYIDYFIFRGLDLLLSQGLLIFIVGSEKHNGGKLFLEKGTSKIKEAIAEKCDLVDAYKLPVKLFQTTDVSSEIIILRRK